MHDMLVKLYDLPDEVPFSKKLRDEGITLRKPIGPEKNVIVDWVKEKFNKAWFPTKARARAEEAAHKAELKKAATNKTRTGTVFSEVANEYLDYLARRVTPKTLKHKAFIFREFIASLGDLPLSKMGMSALGAYLAGRPTNTNYNRHRKELCAMLAWAWKRQKIDQNPCHFLEKLPEPQFVKEIPTQDEMRRLLLAAGKHRPFILVLYHTLARVDEALRLRWRDVNFQDRAITLWTRKRRGGEWQAAVMAMNQVLYDTLWTMWKTKEQEEWVFLNPDTRTRYMRRPRIMGTICKRAGIRHFGFHAIRSYVATLLHDSKKVSTMTISKLLRHKSLRTTEIYIKTMDKREQDAVELL